MARKKWKYIYGYEGMYMVSNRGEIKSLARRVNSSNKKGRVLKERTLIPVYRKGYQFVSLSRKNKRTQRSVARLVAMAFCLKQNHHTCVNHINAVKDDNCASNLEWCTPKENVVHAYSMGLRDVSGNNHPQSILTEKKVRAIKHFLNINKNIKLSTVARMFGVNYNTLYSATKGVSWGMCSI